MGCDSVLSEDWPAGNFQERLSSTMIRSRHHLWYYGLALAFTRSIQPTHHQKRTLGCAFPLPPISSSPSPPSKPTAPPPLSSTFPVQNRNACLEMCLLECLNRLPPHINRHSQPPNPPPTLGAPPPPTLQDPHPRPYNHHNHPHSPLSPTHQQNAYPGVSFLRPFTRFFTQPPAQVNWQLRPLLPPACLP